MSKVVALVAFVLLLVAAPARAATPVKIGVGEEPTVAIDAAGTAHVAFNNDYTSETGQPLMYCAWPRGARGCAPRPVTADDAAPEAQPPLIQTGLPNTITIVSARDDGIDSLQSLDGGATWGAPVPFGQGRFFEGAFGPQGMVLSFDGEFRYRAYGGPEDTTESVDIGDQLGVGSVVGVAPDGRPVFVYGAALPGLRSRAWSGQGDIHDPATWSAPRRIADSNDFALATGPRGLWLLYADFNHGGANPVIARKWTGEKFGRTHRVPRARLGLADIINLGFAQSPQGEMVAVWYNSPRDRLEYAASRTGSRWTAPRVLARGVALPHRISVALGADGRGLVVYDPNFGGDIHAVPISVRSLLRRK